MKKSIQIIFFLFITSTLVAQQSESLDFFVNSGFDKVTITKYEIKDKTSSLPNRTGLVLLDNNKEKTLQESKNNLKINTLYKKINERILNRKEVKKLIKKLRKKLISTYAMNTNENIRIDFFKSDTIVQKISISTYTKSLKVIKEECNSIDIENSTQNRCIYLGKMTSELECYINKLLKR